MFDLSQSIEARKVIKAHGQTWMILYVVPSTKDDIQLGRRVYLATPCSDLGVFTPPCSISVISVIDPDLVPKPPPKTNPRPCKRCGHPESNERHKPTFGYHKYEPPNADSTP